VNHTRRVAPGAPSIDEAGSSRRGFLRINLKVNTMSDANKAGTHVPLVAELAAIHVPTTKILAIGTVTPKGTPDAIGPILPFEARATVRNYLAGKIDHWYFQAESNGVVFIMNVTSTAEAREILEALPLGVAGMMEFQLIALGPLKPLGILLGDKS
jgi:hypothetical protein